MRWSLVLIPCSLVTSWQLASCTTKSCTAKGCINGAQITLDAVNLETLAGGRLRVCRNQVCDSVEIAADGSYSFTEHGLGSELRIGGGGPDQIIVQEPLGSPDLVNGDVYSVEAWDANGASVATLSWAAAYDDEYPNGPDCDEVPCRIAYLDSTNTR